LGTGWTKEVGSRCRASNIAPLVPAVSPAVEQVATVAEHFGPRFDAQRLLWQHCRQSGWLMLAMTVAYVALALMVSQSIVPSVAIIIGDRDADHGLLRVSGPTRSSEHLYFVNTTFHRGTCG
jgi:hypothetical protein